MHTSAAEVGELSADDDDYGYGSETSATRCNVVGYYSMTRHTRTYGLYSQTAAYYSACITSRRY